MAILSESMKRLKSKLSGVDKWDAVLLLCHGIIGCMAAYVACGEAVKAVSGGGADIPYLALAAVCAALCAYCFGRELAMICSALG